MTSSEHDTSPGATPAIGWDEPTTTSAPFGPPASSRVLHRRHDPPSLTVDTLCSDRERVLVVVGSIDQATAPILHRALDPGAAIRWRLTVVDLSAVVFLACAGVSVLIAAHRRVEDRACLRVVAGGRATRRPLALTGADRYLSVHDSRAQALAAPLCDDRESAGDAPADQRLLVTQLQEALIRQPVIEQAKGMIMMLRGWTADQAFTALREVSQHTNVKLHTVAAVVVAAGSRSGRPPNDDATTRAVLAEVRSRVPGIARDQAEAGVVGMRENQPSARVVPGQASAPARAR